ncbi:hypothetical protein P3G55_20060 [Leptospira sp. 96542]|nr:hypothetical protein [Leptospira sp. 96542]
MKDETTRDTTLLSGVSKQLNANSPKTVAITIKNNSGMDLEILALTFRYKAGLEKVLVEIDTPNQKNDPILLGDCTLGGIGSSYENPSFARFHIPGKKPVLTQGQNLDVRFQTFETPINPRDVNLLLDGIAKTTQ